MAHIIKAELTFTEQLIMKCIWDAGEDLPVSEILDRVREKYGKDYAYPTVSTFLTHLKEKGYVSCYKKSHAFQYHPLVAEQEYRKLQMEEYQKYCFDGSAYQFVSTFLENQKLSDEDVKKLKELLDEYTD